MRERRRPAFVSVMAATLMGIAILLPHALRAGDLDPAGPPGPTMKTLDEIPPTWSQKLDAGNGSTAPLFLGCGSSRFECVLYEGTPVATPKAVLDKETGLVWARNAIGDGTTKTWQSAIDYCAYLTLGGRKGWRLPTREELASLIDPSITEFQVPKLPPGHPFLNADFDKVWWSSTTYESDSNQAWRIGVGADHINYGYKSSFGYAWPVRGGSTGGAGP